MEINIRDCVNGFDFEVFHDIVFEATGESFVDQDLDEILNELPEIIKQEIAEWRMCDTLSRDIIFDYLSEED